VEIAPAIADKLVEVGADLSAVELERERVRVDVREPLRSAGSTTAPESARARAACSTAEAISSSTGPNAVCVQPTRSAASSRAAGGSGMAYQSAPSGPSSTASASATSRTLRTSRPAWVKRKSVSGKCPVSGTRPWVGLSPTTPQ
jgi:hypothetical protein